MDHGAADPELTVLIADDDPIVRGALRGVLDREGVTVVAEARDAVAALEAVRAHRPGVALVDVDLPAAGGIALIRRLRAEAPEVRVVLLSSDHDHAAAIEGLRAGASGHLAKDAALQAVPPAIRAVARGETAVSRALVGSLVEALRASGSAQPRMRPVRSVLTDREWEVLDLLCDGLSTTGIAERLFLSRETIRSHVKNVIRKLGVSSRAEAVAMAATLRSGAAPRLPARSSSPPESRRRLPG